MALSLKSDKRSAVILALVLVVLAVVLAASLRSCGGNRITAPKMFVTADDGVTYTAVPYTELPPLIVDGKEVVQALLFRDAGDKIFVGYLLKYSPEAKNMPREGMPATPAERDAIQLKLNQGTLVKKPGQSAWVPVTDARAADVIRVLDPGSGNVAERYMGP